MSYLNERLRLARPLAAVALGSAVWVLSLVCALSFNLWRDVSWFRGMTPFQALDLLTTCIMLPMAALLTSLLVGYRVRRQILQVELYRESKRFIFVWRACLRYIAPPVIVVIMWTAILQYL